MQAPLTLTDQQSDLVTFVPLDAAGKPGALVTSTIVWASDSAAASVTADSANPLEATVKGISPGTANVSFTAQILTAGVPGGNTTVSFPVIVTGGPFTGGTFSFAPPTAS